MKHLLLLLVLLPVTAIAQGIYASVDGAMTSLDVNGTVTIGYRVKGLHVGVGTGMSRVTFQNSVIKSYGLYHPAFAEVCYFGPKKKVSPFASARGGFLLSSKYGVIASPINIDGSHMATLKAGTSFRKRTFYFIPFVQYHFQQFDKRGSRNVGVQSQIGGVGAGVSFIFY